MVQSFNNDLIIIGIELKKSLKESAKKNCAVEKFFCVERPIKLVPLHMTQQKVESADEWGHFHTRDEIAESISKNPVRDIVVEELFIKAKEHAKAFFQNPAEEAEENDDVDHGNVVGLIGQAGIGKTTLSKSILARAANKRLFDAEYVFFLQFRYLEYQKKTNLLSFLAMNLPVPLSWIDDEKRRNAVLTELVRNKHIVIIFDGLDEAILDPSTPYSGPSSLFDIVKPEIFIKQFLRGNLFPWAKTIFTSRPRQLLELHQDIRPHFIVNITGLDFKAQSQICSDICGENAEKIFDFLIHHPQISCYCFVPSSCILIMHSVNNFDLSSSESQSSLPTPYSMTGVLAIAIGLFMRSPHARNVKLSLKRLAKLAWKGIEQRKFYFTKKDLDEVGISKEMLNFFFSTTIAKSTTHGVISYLCGDPEKFSYFVHLIVQEFFAVLKLILFTSSLNFQKLFLGLPHSKPIYDLRDNTWEVVAKFLFGLCNSNNLKILKEMFPSIATDCFGLFPSIGSSLKTKSKILRKFAITVFPKNRNSSQRGYFDSVLRICAWAYEMHDDEFAAEIASRLDSTLLVIGRFLPNDVAPLHYILEHRKSSLHLDTTRYDTLFIGDSLELFLQEIKNKNVFPNISVCLLFSTTRAGKTLRFDQ